MSKHHWKDHPPDAPMFSSCYDNGEHVIDVEDLANHVEVDVLYQRLARVADENPDLYPVVGQGVGFSWLGMATSLNGEFDIPVMMKTFLLLYLMMPGIGATSIEAEMLVATAASHLLYAWIFSILLFTILGLITWVYLAKLLITFVPWAYKEYRMIRMATGVYGALSLGLPLVTKVFSKWYYSGSILLPQGARQTGNRIGMFLTGVLSLCLFLLAPIMGSKRIMELLAPILQMLKQVPYATWMADWLKKWWEGEVDFDDLPQDVDSFKDQQQDLDLKDLQDLANKIRDERVKFKTASQLKETRRMVPEPIVKLDEESKDKWAEATVKLDDMLNQVDEDVGRGTTGLTSSDEKIPENNIPFDYSKMNFIAEKRNRRQQTREGKEKIQKEICQQTTQSTSTDEMLEQQAFFNWFYEAKKEPTEVKESLAKKCEEVPGCDEANDQWWNFSWESGPTWDSLYDRGVRVRDWVVENQKPIAIGIAALITVVAISSSMFQGEEVQPQAKGRTRRGRGVRVRKGGRHNHDPSGGAEKDAPIFDEFADDWDYEGTRVDGLDTNFFSPTAESAMGYMTLGRPFSKKGGKQLGRQAAGVSPSVPTLRDDARIKRVVTSSKKRNYTVDRTQLSDFLTKANFELKKMSDQMKPQVWNPDDKSAGIFKIEDDQGRYRCTGTLVGQRMFVVNHVINEQLIGFYRAYNHRFSIKLDLSKFQIQNDEVGWFPVNGIPSPFKNNSLKVLDTAALVTIYGFGGGEGTTPDVMPGFASVAGWCSVKTRGGDCSSPVLDVEGKIVGFWTHGNGRDFGRFEPITPEWKEDMKEDANVAHTGLDFRFRPLSQNIS